MASHVEDFARGIAMVLQGESLKASCYVTHGASLGTLREKMVSNFVRHETPERFRVGTGLVRSHDRNVTSRQCDLLIYESDSVAPLYRWDDFVIVHDTAARAVIEVKSEMDQRNFDKLLDVHISLIDIELRSGGGVFIPTFGYGLCGVAFETFLTYLKNALTSNRLNVADNQRQLNLPLCITVQKHNYLGIRPLRSTPGNPDAFCVVDFSKATDQKAQPVDGIETGFFLHFYTEVLRSRTLAIEDTMLYQWFNNLPVGNDGKAWVTPDGVIHPGNVDVP